MQDVDKTKEQLVAEVAHLRQRIAELEKSEAPLEKEAILNTLVEHVIHEDREMRILWTNKAACDSVGLSREELIGRHCYEIWPKRSDPCPDCPVVKAMETGQPQEVEKMTLDGRSWFIRGYPLRDAQDNIIGGIESTLEITERKRAEEELKENEQRYKELADSIADVFFAMDKDLRYTYWNKASEKLTGVKAKDAIGKSLYELFPEVKGTKADKLYREVVKTQQRKSVVQEYWLGDKSFIFEISTYPSRDGLSVFVKDITERKRAEEELQESEEKWRSLAEHAPDYIVNIRKDGTVISINRTFPLHTKEQVIGTKIYDYVSSQYHNEMKSSLNQVFQDGKLSSYSNSLKKPDGSTIWFECRIGPIFHDGQITSAILIATDITDRKQTEEALRESEERYRALFEGAPDAIFLADPETGEILDANPAASRLLLRSHEEIVALHQSQLHPPHIEKYAREKFIEYLQQIRQKKQIRPIENAVIRSDGSEVPVEILAQVMQIHGRPVIQGTFRDITARKQAEEALRESEERYRTLVDNIDLGINLIDSNHNIVMVNATMGDKFNKPISEIIRKKCFREFEKRDAVCPHCPGIQTMATGQPAEVETEGVRDDGSRFDVRLQTYPVFGGDSKPIAFIEIAEDITERKQMEGELRESEEKYRSLVESSEDSIYLVDKDCIYLFINKKHLSRLGVKSSKVIGRAYGEFHSLEETRDFRQKVEKVFKTGKSLSYGYRSERDNRYFIRTLNPVKASEGGEPTAATVISKDITEVKLAEEALREREAFNFALFHYNPIETIVVDLEGKVTGFNLAKKQSGDRLPSIGDVMYKDYAGKHEIDMRAELIECIRIGKTKRFPERRYGDKHLSITISPFSQGALIISEDITERKQAQEALQSSREQLRNLTTYLESVREQERTVIAREIHDELAQALTALKMDLSWLDNRMPRDNMLLIDKTKSMSGLIDTTIKTVKRISAELRPGILDDLGLVAALEWQAEEFQDRTGIACHVTVEPEDITVDQDRATAIFRIFQETLTNVARHARATRVTVSLKETRRALTLRVKDNGIGITEEQIADSKSFGLIGIRERVYQWGGNVSITGTPGKGTRVMVSVPAKNGKSEKSQIKDNK